MTTVKPVKSEWWRGRPAHRGAASGRHGTDSLRHRPVRQAGVVNPALAELSEGALLASVHRRRAVASGVGARFDFGASALLSE